MKLPRFSIRTLLLFTLVAAVFSGCTLALYRAGREKSGYGPYSGKEEWPRSLQAFVRTNLSFGDGVTPFGLSDFIDHRSIWRLQADAPLLEHLVLTADLESTSMVHPKSGELIKALPRNWKTFDWPNCKWYATPGYGSKHIEGVDLYLLVVDPQSGDGVVLHESLF